MNMKNLLLLCTAAILFIGCSKEIDELPPATQTGANSFGARVNGALWTPMKFGIAPSAPILEARFNGTGGFFINARNFSEAPTETEMEIFIKDLNATGTYNLNANTSRAPSESASYAYYIKRRLMPLNEWITTAEQTGSVTITRYDTAAGIVSGTFSFRAASTDNTADALEVTEGRFDVKVQ